MKNIIFIFILLLSLYTPAQTLYTDDKGVKIFYKILQTGKFVLCESNPYSDENFSKEKIYIWKVTFGIENGYSGSIVPRGVGIATISVIPNPLQPYSHNYCNYEYIDNYEPNSKQRHLDQSLYLWPIRDYKVKVIKAGESISNITYLYLFEGQTPKLSNWQFLGYRLTKDFKSYDPILNDIVAQPKSVTLSDNKMKEKANKLEVKYKNEISVDIENKPIESKSVTILENISNLKTKNLKIKNNNTKATKTLKVKTDKISVDSIDSATIEEIEPIKDLKNRADSITLKKCPGKKALKYKEKSNNSTDTSAQRAYSWLALYYTYKCECEMGSSRSDQLVPMINNLVDSYTTNTNDEYGKISKVSKCKAPIIN